MKVIKTITHQTIIPWIWSVLLGLLHWTKIWKKVRITISSDWYHFLVIALPINNSDQSFFWNIVFWWRTFGPTSSSYFFRSDLNHRFITLLILVAHWLLEEQSLGKLCCHLYWCLLLKRYPSELWITMDQS